MGHQESVLEALLTGIVLYFLVLRLDRLFEWVARRLMR